MNPKPSEHHYEYPDRERLQEFTRGQRSDDPDRPSQRQNHRPKPCEGAVCSASLNPSVTVVRARHHEPSVPEGAHDMTAQVRAQAINATPRLVLVMVS